MTAAAEAQAAAVAAAKIDAAKAEAAAARERSAGLLTARVVTQWRAALLHAQLAPRPRAGVGGRRGGGGGGVRGGCRWRRYRPTCSAKLLKAKAEHKATLAALFTAVVPELAAEELRTSALRLALGRVGVDCEAVAAELRAVEDEVEAPLRAASRGRRRGDAHRSPERETACRRGKGGRGRRRRRRRQRRHRRRCRRPRRRAAARRRRQGIGAPGGKRLRDVLRENSELQERVHELQEQVDAGGGGAPPCRHSLPS